MSMKKIIFTFLISIFFLNLMAQREVVTTESFKAPFSIETSAKTNDTLYPPSAILPCFDSLTIYGAGPAGYVLGNNSYGDKEKAQKYNFTGDGTVSSVLAYVIAKTTTGNTSVKIYSINPTTKAPSTMLGQSATVALSAVPVNNITIYNFTTPVSFTGNFAASVVLPTGATDTLVVVSTKSGCHSNDSLAWEMQSDGLWYSVETQWGVPPNSLKCDMIILPVVQTVVGMTQMTQDNIMSIFPNPANDYINIAAINNIEKISVFNTMGQLVKSIEPNNNILKLDISDLQSGFYILQVLTEKGMVAKTISVQ